MYKPQAFSEKSTYITPAFFTLRELSALTGISKGAIYHAVAKGNSYFRAVRSLILKGREELMPDRVRFQCDCGSAKNPTV